MLKNILFAPIVCLILSISSVSFACSLAGYQDFNVDPSLPAIVFEDFDVSVKSVKRGANSGSSCDDLGWVVIEIDKVDPEVGYKVEVVDGTTPENMGQILSPVIPDNDNTLLLVWSEDMSDEQPPLSFRLRVTAIGPNGDVGTTDDVFVSDPGNEGGCSATGRRDVSLFGLFMFGLVVRLRRRR